jgi:hypothetical protein
MRSVLTAQEFHAVAAQNIVAAIRTGKFLSLCSLTASSPMKPRTTSLIEEISGLIVDSLRGSDSIGKLGEDELGILLPGARRLDAFSVLFELGGIAHWEALVAEDVTVHVGIAEVDPSYPASTVGDLLDVARHDLQIPAVPWSARRDLPIKQVGDA